jgi:hypothetical protein
MRPTKLHAVDALCRELTNKGKLIEAGWLSFKAIVVPANAPAVQINEMRKAFFIGAQHLFASIISIMESGTEPTEKDLNRMSQISQELDDFVDQCKADIAKASGNQA